MLIRLMEYDFSSEEDDMYKNPHLIKGYEEKNFDKLVNTIISLKGCDVRVGDEFYTIDDIVFNFPEFNDNIPTLDIMCIPY